MDSKGAVVMFDMTSIEQELGANTENLYEELLADTKKISQIMVDYRMGKKSTKRILSRELNQLIKLTKELKQSL